MPDLLDEILFLFCEGLKFCFEQSAKSCCIVEAYTLFFVTRVNHIDFKNNWKRLSGALLFQSCVPPGFAAKINVGHELFLVAWILILLRANRSNLAQIKFWHWHLWQRLLAFKAALLLFMHHLLLRSSFCWPHHTVKWVCTVSSWVCWFVEANQVDFRVLSQQLTVSGRREMHQAATVIMG